MLKQIWASIEETGGASYCFQTGVLNPVNGYFASVKGKEFKCMLPDSFKAFKAIVKLYIGVNNGIFDTPNTYIGFWVEKGVLYIDLSKHFLNPDKGIKFGIENKQKAIFNCVTKQSIYIQ